MSYVFERTNHDNITVGIFTGHGKWMPLIDVASEHHALLWIRWLNGGDPKTPMPPIEDDEP